MFIFYISRTLYKLLGGCGAEQDASRRVAIFVLSLCACEKEQSCLLVKLPMAVPRWYTVYRTSFIFLTCASLRVQAEDTRVT